MIDVFIPTVKGVSTLLKAWEPRLIALPDKKIGGEVNGQNRTIKQIVGHMIDSASNNTHRVVHLQYHQGPSRYPNYATYGNNDRWIAIQNYAEESWVNMVNLWKFSNLHWIHVVKNIAPDKLDCQWYYDDDKLLTLQEMVIDYHRHIRLHLWEIEELLGS